MLKGESVTFEYRGFRVVGVVRRVLRDGTRTIQVTEAEPEFERYMCQTIDECIMLDVKLAP